MKQATGALAALSCLLAVFGAASAAETPPLTFEQALAAILSRSTSIAAQEANLGNQRARNIPIRLAFTPSLTLDARQTTAGGASSGSSFDSRQVTGTAQLNLFRWGADVKNWQAATQDESNRQALLDDAYLTMQDGGVTALVAYFSRKREIAVTEGIVKMRQDSLAIAKQRYGSGYLPRQDMEKVSVDLSNAEARLADARIASALAAANLANLLGHSHVATDWPWRERFAALKAADVEALAAPVDPTRAATRLSARPDWRAAQARLEAEEARLSRNWRLMGPTLDGRFSYGYYSDLSGFVSPPGAYGAPQWQGVISVSFPILDQLTLYSNARAQAFIQSGAEIALEQVRRDALTEWEGARQTLATAILSAQVRDRTLGLSRSLYQDGLQRFRAGRISADELVIEQTRLYDSELLAVQGWAAVHLAHSRLCKARGLRLADCALQ